MSFPLTSLQEQIDRKHVESGEDFLCVHLDTCLSSYLHDHHNREGELLLGAFVDGQTTYGEVLAEVLSEFDSVAYELSGESPGYDHAKARAAVRAAFSELHPMELDRSYFDSSLDIMDEEEREDASECCQAWFLITWRTTGDSPSDS